ncbi:MAG: succinate dehydrogenase, cytochrome b556 subunit, partial [Caulobacterales bacterium]|nr:succinate dehydrogenase, cytochrome b556 subunit [Caulobacterales bacterium]
MSPHLQVWRWHVTMATSIAHRASGAGMYFGGLVLVAWLGCVVAGPEAYAVFEDLALSPLGPAALFALTLAVTYH